MTADGSLWVLLYVSAWQHVRKHQSPGSASIWDCQQQLQWQHHDKFVTQYQVQHGLLQMDTSLICYVDLDGTRAAVILLNRFQTA